MAKIRKSDGILDGFQANARNLNIGACLMAEFLNKVLRAPVAFIMWGIFNQ